MYESIDSLLDDLQKDIRDLILNEVNEAGKQCVKDAIDKKVYSRIPKVYQRTFTLRDSVGSDIVFRFGEASMNFYNKPNSMANTKYPSTMKSRSQDNREFISEWINEGHTLWGKRRYRKTKYMEYASSRIELEIHKSLVSGLKEKGYKVKIR